MSRFVGVLARLDAWYNSFTGLGTTRDKGTQAAFLRSALLDPETLDNLYHGDDLARRVVAALPDEAMRHGFELCNEDTAADAVDSSKDEDAIWENLTALGVAEKAHAAMVWGRLFGGAGLLVIAEGGGDPAMPLQDEKVTNVVGLEVFDRRDMTPVSYYADIQSPKFGRPATYRYNPISVAGAVPVLVHESRLIIFGGALTSNRRRKENQSWDASVIDVVYQVLQQANTNWQSVCHLMTDMSQGVFKVKGLMDLIAAGQESIMRSRMEVAELGRAVNRSLILDADGEDFTRVATPLTGVPDLVTATWQRLAAAAEMPVTVLMGVSPAGMNATGESDVRNWYDRVRSYQERTAKPPLSRLIRLVAQVSGVANPESWGVEFPSLWQMTPKEQADLALQVANADKLYVDMGAVLPEEVALARSSEDGEYSVGFVPIDMQVRKAALGAELKKLGESAGKPDPVPPTLPALPAPEQKPPEMQGGELKPVEQPKKDAADVITALAHALKELREAGVVVDKDKLAEQFPELPIKNIIEE